MTPKATLYPTIDFLQPWLIQNWSQERYQAHLSRLKESGYNGVILQYTRTGAVGNSNVYYPTEALQDLYEGDLYVAENDVPEMLLTAADALNMKVWLGLSVEDEWWSLGKMTDNTWMQYLADIDNAMLTEMSEMYTSHASFAGWYWAYEVWNNPDCVDVWSAMLNKTIAHLNAAGDTYPLMLSPFMHWIFKGDNDANYAMWVDFLTKVNFRSGDILAPQDSLGKISNGIVQEDKLSTTDLRMKQIRDAITAVKPQLTYYVNCELFYMASDGSLHTASIDRCKEQFKIANKYAQGIITFSYSHYCVEGIAKADDEYAIDFEKNYKAYLLAEKTDNAA